MGAIIISEVTDHLGRIILNENHDIEFKIQYGSLRFQDRKNDIKRLGAKWNPEKQTWICNTKYVPSHLVEYVINIF